MRIPMTLAVALAAAAPAADAADVLQSRLMSLELARDIANFAVEACREDGFQVSAVVVDKSGVVQAVLRDVYASRFNTELATKKANAVILSGASGSEFLANRPDFTDTANHLDDVLVLKGAVPIRAAGAMLGAIGVSGAYGGEADEKCAMQALDAVSERLEFAE